MTVLAMPLALLAVAALLVLATQLEQRRVHVLVRLTVKSKSSPELAERVIASELAPVLAASGLTNRPVSRRRSAPA